MSGQSAAARIEELRQIYADGQPDAEDLRDLIIVVDHVVGVLRDAKRNGGGYGFVRHLLQYLAGDDE